MLYPGQGPVNTDAHLKLLSFHFCPPNILKSTCVDQENLHTPLTRLIFSDLGTSETLSMTWASGKVRHTSVVRAHTYTHSHFGTNVDVSSIHLFLESPRRVENVHHSVFFGNFTSCLSALHLPRVTNLFCNPQIAPVSLNNAPEEETWSVTVGHV